jgi:hypothetical protein
MSALVVLVGFVAVLVALGWLILRWTKRPPTAPDLLRANDTETELPDAESVTDRVSGTIVQSWPLK